MLLKRMSYAINIYIQYMHGLSVFFGAHGPGPGPWARDARARDPGPRAGPGPWARAGPGPLLVTIGPGPGPGPLGRAPALVFSAFARHCVFSFCPALFFRLLPSHVFSALGPYCFHCIIGPPRARLLLFFQLPCILFRDQAKQV